MADALRGAASGKRPALAQSDAARRPQRAAGRQQTRERESEDELVVRKDAAKRAAAVEAASARQCKRRGDQGGGEEEEEAAEELTVNREFAERAEKTARQAEADKRRALLQRVADREEEGEEEEADESEDDDGKLLTPAVDLQVHRTIAAIRSRDPAIYDHRVRFFGGDASGDEATQRPRERKLTLKEFATKQLLAADGFADEAEDEGSEAEAAAAEAGDGARALPYVEEQARLKREFLRSVAEAEAAEGREGQDAGDAQGGLKKKKKEKEKEKEKEEARSKEEAEAGDGDLFTVKIRERADGAGAGRSDTKRALQRFLGPEDALTADDVFLRDYVLHEWWREKDPSKLPSYEQIKGEEEPQQPDVEVDEEDLERQDEFEAEYNFRFQEPGADRIATYPRKLPDAVRQQESARKKARQAHTSRKEEEKKKKIEEIKRLRNAKREAILDKLRQLREITGAAAGGFDLADLEGEFDPEEHERRMRAVFSREWEEAPLPEDEAARIEAMGGGDEGEGEEEEEEEEEEEKEQQQGGEKRGVRRDEEAVAEEAAVDEEGEEEDAPAAAILGEEVAERGAALKPGRYLEETRKKLRQSSKADKAEIERQLDELYKLDFEDVIGGDLPCRFKYIKIEPRTFGMTVEEILATDDRELNRRVSIKKLRPYREDVPGGAPWWQLKRESKERHLRRRAAEAARKARAAMRTAAAATAAGATPARGGADAASAAPKKRKKGLNQRQRKRKALLRASGGDTKRPRVEAASE